MAGLVEARPDASGRFFIPQVPSAGNIYLAATAQGMAEAQYATSTPATAGTATLHLSPEGMIRGQLQLDPTVASHPDVVVFARSWALNGVAHPFTGVVQANGTFEIRGLPAGDFNVIAAPRAHPAAWTSLPVQAASVTAGAAVSGLSLRLESGQVLSGTVRDPVTG
ncbi:MAG: hypothetical protein HC888_18010 [Candidatus Competibacteraceae bacterium]|nr:hypothetical protein [Candidatus Competibacteraceae bacterium]